MGLLDEFKNEELDPRFVFISPTFVLSFISAYLMFVYQIGPRLMKNREAFRLKRIMIIYNMLQVASCLYLNNGIWQLASWGIFHHFKCITFLPNTPQRATFDSLIYFLYWLKIFELCDTVIFVLRKKTKQVTYLHVFHHSSAITLAYLLLKYFRGMSALYPIFLNCWVHVVMYSYYFFANICSPEVMQKFIIIKKSITIMQMIQFCMVLFHAVVLYCNNCQIPAVIVYYYCIVVSVMFYGFYDFYKKAYLKTQATNLTAKAK